LKGDKTDGRKERLRDLSAVGSRKGAKPWDMKRKRKKLRKRRIISILRIQDVEKKSYSSALLKTESPKGSK